MNYKYIYCVSHDIVDYFYKLAINIEDIGHIIYINIRIFLKTNNTFNYSLISNYLFLSFSLYNQFK